ncbi:MAG: alpha/beta hydrolase fold domain-containing protein [Gemmatimonadales bacterium]|nr:alpha/beta hydrolase fold domain-containing protein [Gemmatimonadales bacterium]
MVRDADGNGIAGVSVTFTVTNGGGSVAPGSVVTGNDGRAASDGWTLGTAAGANPAQIQDVKCAIRHLRARAAEYGLDPDRIGAWGGSAGGQLVALLGSADAAVGFDGVGEFQGISSEVQAVIAISAITDFTSPDELRDNYSRAFRTWPDLHAGHSLEPVSGPIDPAPETITTRMAAFLDQHLR